jgi:trans-AT polyketide synthase/acyltransferase/oxidoreductase domain-containing protein
VKKVVFLFSGQGSQYYQMGRELYENHPVFKESMEKLDEVACRILGESVLAHLYDKSKTIGDLFDRTLYTHPAIFMVEVSLARVLIESGVRPNAVVGASLGEFAAAAVAGVADVEELLEAVITQAHTFEATCPAGGMMAVLADLEWYERLPEFRQHAELAAVNYDTHFVVSGTEDGQQQIASRLQEQKVLHHILPVRHGFHSACIDNAEQVYKAYLAGKSFRSPAIRMISCLYGRPVESLPADYFWNIAREPIQFPPALQYLEREGEHVYLDLGPSGTLANFAKHHLAKGSASQVMTLMSPFHPPMKQLEAVVSQFANHERSREQMLVYLFPGQGSQHVGMGKGLFEEFPELTAAADRILGYSIRTLCLEDPEHQLNKTQFTQPALYVVSALTYLKRVKEEGRVPDYVAGHSVGEFAALFAAGAYDFETGLRLVQKRGELMSRVSGGGMAAVIGFDRQKVERLLRDSGMTAIDVANDNSPSQIVISGRKVDIENAAPVFEESGARYVQLNVSGAFHSRYMSDATEEFAAFIRQFSFSELKLPVISNVHARPYRQEELVDNLVRQITHSVRWTESMTYLMALGDAEYQELGPGTVLAKLMVKIQQETPAETIEAMKRTIEAERAAEAARAQEAARVEAAAASVSERSISFDEQALLSESGVVNPVNEGMHLGSESFKRDYGVKYAYVAGGMTHGISSVELVARLARAGILSFFGTSGLRLDQVERSLHDLQRALSPDQPFGMNLSFRSHDPEDAELEDQLTDLFIRRGIHILEVSGYLGITPALVKYRLNGLKRDPQGNVIPARKLLAKVSRPEVAELFLSPPPQRIVDALLKAGRITAEEAMLAASVSMADDLCAISDAAGTTDRIPMHSLLPMMIQMREEAMQQHRYAKPIRIGYGGSIGTPQAAASAFFLGADFILTGSINQCTVEAGTSAEVKQMLAGISVQDTEYVPAHSLFEMGGKAQVLKKGLLFPTRANKLYEIYRQYQGLDELDAKTKRKIEDKYFGCTLEEAFRECERTLTARHIEKAADNPQYRMLLLFKWYLMRSTEQAITGDSKHRVNYQIFCSPALGAFNQWVKGTDLEDWRNRHVDRIAVHLMRETALYMNRRSKSFVETNLQHA